MKKAVSIIAVALLVSIIFISGCAKQNGTQPPDGTQITPQQQSEINMTLRDVTDLSEDIDSINSSTAGIDEEIGLEQNFGE